MADLFAFDVAVLEPETEALGHYDAELQQFVWAGDSEVTLGDALCTHSQFGYVTCHSTGTSCVFGGGSCSTAPFAYCWRVCDYG
jgi:hypothetical protein